MNTSEIISVAVIGIGLFTTIVKVWYAHDRRLSSLESKSIVCDEKHKNHDRIQLKQAEINTKVDEHHIEIMTTLATIQQQIANLIDKMKH
jgi:hypothetical protein